jgi:tyrosyl-DNA phosphodiesterase-1
MTKESEIDDDTTLYFGSHNFSAGAWGNIEKDGTQISMSNWEIGVVFPPMKGSQEMKLKMVNNMVLKFPAKRYCLGDIPFCRDKHIMYTRA